MPNRCHLLPTVTLTMLLSACGGSDSDPGTPGIPGASTLMALSAEPAGINCAAGGSKIEAGLDVDGNGRLDPLEVRSTQYACNGAAGSVNMLVRMLDEPSGANCAAGGKTITVGTDSNGNGVLEAGDVLSSGYVCNGTNGITGPTGPTGANTLMIIVSEAAGVICPYGGNKVTSGLDSNANGALDAGEAGAPSYICNGVPGASLNWEVISGATNAKPDTGYIVASSETAQVVVTLPTNAELLVGDVVRVSGMGLGGWKIAQNPGQAVDTTDLGGMAGAIWTPRGPTAVWSSVASSADGSKLVAVAAGGTIWTSINGGASWKASSDPSEIAIGNWTSVASSADGSKLVAVAAGGTIWISIDGGVSWTPSSGPPEIAIGNWTSVASSADGSKLVAAAAGGTIWTSINGGVTWGQSGGSAPSTKGYGNWTSVGPSADGGKLVRVAGLGGSFQPDSVWTSSTGDVSLMPNLVPLGLGAGAASVASSADGWNLVGVNSSGEIWLTRSGGDKGWGQTSAGAGTSHWTSVASSADGRKLVAVNVNPANSAGEIWTSADSGASWVQRSVGASTPPWTSVASSADGSRLVASAAVGQIYTSTDSGATWTARESDRFWTAVASSADGSRLVAVAGPTPEGGQIYVSTPTTTLGTLGTISGGASDAIELLYVGNGMFKVLSHEGKLTVQ